MADGQSPWGEPSDQLLTGTFHGVDLVFLPRHGRGHIQTPTSINYRANVDALKRIGVTDVISVSACGSLREELPPGTFVMADQFIDRRTRYRPPSAIFCSGCSTLPDAMTICVPAVVAILRPRSWSPCRRAASWARCAGHGFDVRRDALDDRE